ncbi:alpha/beta hydrolase [Parafrankia sp. EUN1f]|uniref:alpha/beta hydrolase n=1 Tax=Parafrankia sp. EUN1f TaxID=102897 RepID=UPI0001C44D54|nr:alpha/beta hydrolase [Parafrankia sp. EUN1f]EFC86602.1 hypothetical protein FrEUN1fDRAFT_0287 [Parafrankia sp. EUN1f]
MTPLTATISPRLAEHDTDPAGRLAGETVRATVAMLTGRGESPKPYEWLAARLALDGYSAAIVPGGVNVARAVGEVRRPGLPFVLLGSDSGALAALAMAGSPAVRPDGLALLGLPLLHVPVAGIPVADPPPRVLPDIPILLVHGRDDQISPLSLVRMTTRTATRADLTVVPGGHSVLAGPGRRCVPARVLLFIEELIDRIDRIDG